MISRKNNFQKQFITTLLFLTISCLPLKTSAEMVAISDKQLDAVYAQGFANFSIVGDIARAEFDINTFTYTEIDSMKLGYYDDGINGVGWDNDWTNVKLGSPTEDLVANGVFFEAQFTNINDPSIRELKSVKFGTMGMSGTITADFNTFSGDIAAGTPVSGHRLTPAFTQITSNIGAFYVSIEVDGPNKGIHVHFDNATTN
jgi:hypothetical protein